MAETPPFLTPNSARTETDLTSLLCDHSWLTSDTSRANFTHNTHNPSLTLQTILFLDLRRNRGFNALSKVPRPSKVLFLFLFVRPHSQFPHFGDPDLHHTKGNPPRLPIYSHRVGGCKREMERETKGDLLSLLLFLFVLTWMPMKKQSPTTSKIFKELCNVGSTFCRSYARDTCCTACELVVLEPHNLHSAIPFCIISDAHRFPHPAPLHLPIYLPT